MSTSPTPTKLHVPTNPVAVAADVVSYGYAVAVVLATMQFNLAFELWQGVALTVLFILMRSVAWEIRKDDRKRAIAALRRKAAAKAKSPAMWNVEQRDGYGRRVDVNA